MPKPRTLLEPSTAQRTVAVRVVETEARRRRYAPLRGLTRETSALAYGIQQLRTITSACMGRVCVWPHLFGFPIAHRHNVQAADEHCPGVAGPLPLRDQGYGRGVLLPWRQHAVQRREGQVQEDRAVAIAADCRGEGVAGGARGALQQRDGQNDCQHDKERRCCHQRRKLVERAVPQGEGGCAL